MTRLQRAQESQYELAVAIFLEGLTDDPPADEDYDLDEDRRQAIVDRAVRAA